MVKNGDPRKESIVYNKYNKSEERRRESDDWGSGLRKQSIHYGNIITFEEIVYDDIVEANHGGEKCFPLFLGGTKLPKGHTLSTMHP